MMLNYIEKRIGLKIICVFVGILLIGFTLLSYLFISQFTVFGRFSAEANEQSIRSNTNTFLKRITHEQTMRIEAFVRRVNQTTQFLSAHASDLLIGASIYARTPFRESHGIFVCNENGVYHDPSSQKVLRLFWGKDIENKEVDTQIRALSHLEPYFIQSKDKLSEIVSLSLITELSFGMFYPNNFSGMLLPPMDKMLTQKQQLIRKGVSFDRSSSRAIWSVLPASPSDKDLKVIIIRPVYDFANRYLGMVVVDVLLDRVLDGIFMDGLGYRLQGGEKIFSFLIDNAGNPVFFPEELKVLLGSYQAVYSCIQSMMKKTTATIHSFPIKDKNYIVSTSMVPSSEWHVGLVIPESAVLNSVSKTHSKLNDTVTEMTYRTILITVLFTAGSVLISVIVIGHLLKPLKDLASVASEIKAGNFETRIKSERTDEIGRLASAFDEMSEGLSESYFKLEENNRLLEMEVMYRKEAEGAIRNLNKNLEQMVNQRTAQLIKAKEEAEAASLSKSQFLANMSHEIRTPLNGIVGNTILALQTTLSNEQKEYIEAIDSSAEHLLSVINDILDISKIEAGRLDIAHVDFDLYSTIELALTSLVVKAYEKGLTFDFYIEPNVPKYVVGDPVRIRQVIFNLAGNAVKYTDFGEVHVKCKVHQYQNGFVMLHFIVSDTGIGIPNDKIEKIFDIFEQGDGSMTRRYGGTGLGLTISRQLVEMMGGEIWVSSRLGEGSHFHFTVRLAVSKTKRLKIHGRDMKNELRGRRILIVDKDEDRQRTLMEILTSWGAISTCVNNREKAVEETRKAEKEGTVYDVVLMDTQLSDPCVLTTDGRMAKIDHLNQSLTVMETFMDLDDMTFHEKIAMGQQMPEKERQARLYETLCSAIENNKDRQLTARSCLPAVRSDNGPIRALKILLVEDHFINQKLGMHLFRKMGHSITLARNGEEAVDLFDTQAFDIVFMDIQMPVMDGIKATAVIREKERLSELLPIPIIAMTAHALKGDEDRCIDAGMNDYIAKPVNPETLSILIEKWAKKKTTHHYDVLDGSGGSYPVK